MLIKRQNAIALVLLGLTLVISLLYLFQVIRSPEALVTHIPDDAFYYFQIAKHLAQGQGSTFDGMTLTNGYHPLWMIMIVPLFAVFSSALSAAYASIVLGYICYLATAAVLAKFLHAIGVPRVWVAIGCLLWMSNPWTMHFATNGLETSLATLCLAGFFWKIYTYAKHERFLIGQRILLGVLAAMCILARIDYVIYIAYAFAWFLLKRPVTLKQKIEEGVMMGGVTGLLILPWFVWNAWQFGALVQTSGTTFTFVQRSMVEYANRSIHPLIRFAKASFSKTIEGLELLLRISGLGSASLLVIGYICGGSVAGKELMNELSARDAVEETRYSSLAWLIVPPMGIYFLANVSYRWAARNWYFAHVMLLLILCITPYCVALWKNYVSKRGAVYQASIIGMFLLIVMGGYGWYAFKYMRTPFPEQRAMLAAAKWLDESLPSSQRIGVYNSGIIGFFNQKHTIINIDGLVNNTAAKYLRTHTLANYLRKERITYIADFENAVFFKYAIVGWWGDPSKDILYKETLPKPEGVQNPIKLYQVQ